ncbi:cell cycle checkpoint control protein RAD9A [Vitis riparia]|uniref:cell cycle checkpoint control protein RAD9A n=1 Tax=Vitis riparia TaxID=96939 RepID=UPI00155AD019|nr:cell cycle checkpoint control protein RAD9A [Vitis riparia]XP_034705927.1 cell cycle checkpoint control protein RAD9A [Vitis riparia]
MEWSLSGNALKTFARSVTCLARVGNELAIQASPSQLAFHTINSSRSAYQSITFKPDFFDLYTISGAQVQCSVLLKAICAVLRTPIASIDHLSVQLPDPDASKVQLTLNCYNGVKKAYWITCNVEPDIQHLSLDRTRFPSNFVVRPRDLNRLLANFQSSLQEITIIATEPTSLPSDAAGEIGGKAVELRSYIDPTKDNDSSLHTQLWIDPMEEFVQYAHSGDPVDVTFGVKELKAFLSFCEGGEVDIHLFFEKAGEPILMAPKFGLDDGSSSNFDATLVLATMLTSQLHEGNPSQAPPADDVMIGQADHGMGSQAQQGIPRANVSGHPSDHTKIWSDLSGSAAKSGSGAEGRHVQDERNPSAAEQREIQRISTIQISKARSSGGNVPGDSNPCQPTEADHAEDPQAGAEINAQAFSQRHPSNWVDADEDDDEADDNELCVQSTPPYYE